MKIIEVRDGFIKLEADESIYLSSFIRAEGFEKDYIAQINKIQKVGDVVIATAKILFVMKNDELFNYDRTAPSRDADVKPFTLDILNNSVNAVNPVIIGKTFDNSGNITVDNSVFNKKMLISVNNVKTNNVLVRNLSKQFANLGKKTVVIDMVNAVNGDKMSCVKDFKLPLNKDTLQFLYRICQDEATPDSKPLIAEVFNDLAEYSQTVPFVPFGVLKSIVDDMVDKQHVFKLFVLKNKLSYLQRKGYFANTQNEVDNLKKLLEKDYAAIDISDADSGFQNCYLEYIYSLLEPSKTQVLLEASNAVTKRNLKMILKDSDVASSIIVNSKYRYLNDLKALFDNFIIEPSLENNKIFSVYGSFLTSMEQDTYLIIGEGINYIPMIAKTQIIDDVIAPDSAKAEAVPEEQSLTEPEISGEEPASEAQEEVLPQEETSLQEEAPAQEDILANIEQKSDELISSVSENLEDIQEVDLFDSDEQDSEDEEIMAENEDASEELKADEEEQEENVIEPEYAEIKEEDSLAEITEDEDNEISNVELDEEIVDLKEDEGEIAEISDLESSDDLTEIQYEELPQEFLQNDEIQVLPDELALNEDDGEMVQEVLSEDVISEDIAEEQIPEELDVDSLENTLSEDSGFEDISLNESENELSADNDSFELSEETIQEDNVAETEEIVELDSEELDENDIIIDLTDEGEENINIDETLDRQIVEDVDKVYTTIKEDDNLEEISESDLDLIDEMNSDGEEVLLEEYSGNLDEGILEQPAESIIPEKQQPAQNSSEILEKRDANTPIVPVYDADIPQEDMVVSDPIQQGDSVVHAKYGNGIVEKMIKYGTKTLFSINFENIGRRLLDPTLTEIKKL